MRVKIRYQINGKEYDEDVIDLVIYNKDGQNILYAYSTIEDTEGVCLVRPGQNVIYPVKP